MRNPNRTSSRGKFQQHIASRKSHYQIPTVARPLVPPPARSPNQRQLRLLRELACQPAVSRLARTPLRVWTLGAIVLGFPTTSESGLWRVRALKLWVLGGASEGFGESGSRLDPGLWALIQACMLFITFAQCFSLIVLAFHSCFMFIIAFSYCS